MKTTIPQFYRPIASNNDVLVQVDSWYESTKAFEEKKYQLSIRKLLEYINPATTACINSIDGDFEFVYPQGSSEVHFKLTNNTFFIEAPFVKITPQTNKIALMRAVAEVNFYPLTLSKIVLDDNLLWFKFETDISLCQPNKMYDVIREICKNADDYDNEFIEKYNAEFFHVTKQLPLNDTEKEQVWNQIKGILSQFKTYQSYFEENRWDVSLWDNIIISLFQLGNMSYINGNLKTDLDEYISNITNNNIDLKFRIDKGTNFFKRLAEKDKNSILKDIYHTKNFITLKWSSTPSVLQEITKGYAQQVNNYVSSNDNFNLSFYLQYIFYRIPYYYSLDEKYKELIYSTLQNASNKEYKEGGAILLDTFYHLLDGTFPQDNATNKPKGFFAKIFG